MTEEWKHFKKFTNQEKIDWLEDQIQRIKDDIKFSHAVLSMHEERLKEIKQ